MPSAWTLDPKEAALQLGCDLNSGLSTNEAEERLKKHGPNRLEEEEPLSFWKIAAHEVTEPMILLLLGVGVIYSFWGKLEDTIAIFVIITILVFVEVFTEFRAKGAIAALHKLVSQTAPVIRDGKYMEVLTTGLVPGDLVLLRVGERVPADVRLVESFGLTSDESQLTGESVPVEKDASVTILDESAPLQERKNMVFAGSIIVRGRGSGVVASTGMATEIGKIAGMVRATREPKTQLQLAMKEMTRWLVWVAVAFSLIVPIVGIIRGQPIKEMVLTGLGLAFATIPEELPIVVTMVLALGALHLSRKKALVKKLQAAETLGSVTVICADKTGTLTENRMKLSRIFTDGQFVSEPAGAGRFLEAAVSSSDVVVSGDEFIGDPTQVALLKAAVESGIRKGDGKLESRYGSLVNEFSFDSIRRMMSTVYSKGTIVTVFAAGAPEAIIEKCTKVLRGERDRSLTAGEMRLINEAMAKMSDESLRVIAFAYKSGYSKQPKKIPQKEAESSLVFVGLAGLLDPPRAEVPEAIRACRSGGIRVLMLTGDGEKTAKAIAAQVGIDSSSVVTGREIDAMDDGKLQSVVKTASIYARVSPYHKLRIAKALKANGEIVAMTGDGVNDAPALKEADIGIAMGETGTDVAKEAAGMVLADDNFSTIVRAVEEGRKIFDNLRKGIGYYLSCKVALVSSAFVPAIIGMPLPFAPIQIIFLELFMDIAASTSFVAEPAEPGLMRRKPRDPSAKFLDAGMRKGIFRNAAALAAAVLVSYFIATFALMADPTRARTIAFGTWMLGHIFLAVNMRSESEPLSKIGVFSNRLILLWGSLSILAFLAAISVPAFTSALKASALSPSDLLLILAVSASATFWIELGKITRSRVKASVQ